MRWIVIGGVLAFTVMVYALLDLTVTDDRRIRRLNRVLWVVLIVVVPLIGPLAWLTWGKGPRSAARPIAPDDDPSFGRSRVVTDSEADRRIAEIEAQLAALDSEGLQAPPARDQAKHEHPIDADRDAAPTDEVTGEHDGTDNEDGRRASGDGPAARA